MRIGFVYLMESKSALHAVVKDPTTNCLVDPLLAFLVFHQFDADHEAAASRFAHEFETFFECLELFQQHLTDLARILNEFFFQNDFERG